MSSSSSSRVKRQKGFSESEVQNFMRAGDTQGLDRKGGAYLMGNQAKPQMRERVDVRTSSTSLFSSNTNVSERSSGFMGEFSNLSQQDVDEATDLFLRRRQQIKQRAGTFGRAGLLLER